ncbi:transcription termination/antitermination protein NusG [Laspinema sp. D1]|uniref:Transcription termination/antitermination protein NusG n=2 Tax=Laspinema TaxID=2584823 RepID=A0ABT2MMS5_9CYAN|nr:MULTISPECIES: transcription termination/antitermination protein NusG [unclassified Laspinema]MCT7961100.1 transcription termination/antitermination protein NusG [Laspinema sp. D2b]MCT7966049.1 transcription termination/antitermination protein NusG [Laspinema sp. D2a]MCT7971734.1 transcription termination/antitermination protein NusG [Laspinema sp. D3d]MCT7977217.1 transcription termination/antitermination protein NusG [Laspinema sp. D3b]MCT7989866.1 transcription termination/antitermination
MMFASDDDSQYSTQPSETDETEESTSSVQKRWYAVQVASGCEKRVKATLEQRIQTLDMGERIFQVEIPQAAAFKIRKDGSRQQTDEKIFPGYVLVQMDMDDESWQVVKNTPHVINFVGAEQKRRYGRGRGHVKPMPLSYSEVQRIFRQRDEAEPVVKTYLTPGEKIEVVSGPFKDFDGEVIEVSPERSKLKALLSIFGRDTPVELEFNQVRKLS